MINKKNIKKLTVESEYQNHIKQILNEHKQLPIKRQQLNQLQTEYNQISKNPLDKLNDQEINHLLQIKTQIQDLNQEIEKLERMENVTEFYLKNGELLMAYYNLSEIPANPQVSNTIKSTPEPVRHNQESKHSNVVTLVDLLGVKREQNNSDETNLPLRKVDLHEQYLIQTDPHHLSAPVYTKTDDYCQKCGCCREYIPSDAIMVCPVCGDEVQSIIESERPSFNDSTHETTYFAYKRITHFKEQLAKFQAKETTKIPPEVYQVILTEFKKEKKDNLKTLTKSQVKKYLLKYSHLDYNKYCENINQIICHLNGIQPVIMTPEVEEQLCNMFIKIQEPFEKHCPSDRSSFLSYSYIIYKFCQLLGYYQYLPHLKLLKSKDKIRQQDKIWKKICEELGWKYYPSL